MLALVSAPAFAAGNSPDKSGVVRAGGLSCFSIIPPDSPVQPETKRAPAIYRSCDKNGCLLSPPSAMGTEHALGSCGGKTA